jgi:hypothetical protein
VIDFLFFLLTISKDKPYQNSVTSEAAQAKTIKGVM